MLYLFVFLELPIVALCLIVWWAVRQTPELEDEPASGDGGTKVRPHPPRRLPRTPRRGPHGDPLPLPSPPRVRTKATARTHVRDG
jgi:hypothetical protein